MGAHAPSGQTPPHERLKIQQLRLNTEKHRGDQVDLKKKTIYDKSSRLSLSLALSPASDSFCNQG